MPTLHPLLHSALIGIGATLFMDAWLMVLNRLGVPTLNFAYIGRLAGHAAGGTFLHASIGKAAPVAHESLLGWGVHYAVGVIFAVLLAALAGKEWLRAPTLWPALGFGLVTVLMPFLFMQPAMGQGIAASRTDAPGRNRIRSMVNHIVFGLGLYLAARLLTPWA